MSESPCILVTGGCGYIGSHTIVCLLTSTTKKYSVVVVDNLVNSSRVALDRIAEITGLKDDERKERLVFHDVDLCDKDAMRKVFEESPRFDACIHFAGLKVSLFCSGPSFSGVRAALYFVSAHGKHIFLIFQHSIMQP